MSITPSTPPQSAHHSAMRPGSPPTVKTTDTRRRLQLLTITPGAVTIVMAAVTIAYFQASATLSTIAVVVILSLAGLICLGVLATSSALIAGILRTRQEQVDALRTAVAADTAAMPELIHQRQNGDAHPYGSAVNAPSHLGSLTFTGGELVDLAHDVAQLRRAALEAVKSDPPSTTPQPTASTPTPPEQPQQGIIETPNRTAGNAIALDDQAIADNRVSVFVNLARRLQSLVHREIKLLDELEAQVEDPDLLKGLFSVDHLATRIRRHAENLAVLGGAVSRRQWSRPVNLYEVLRSAVAEVEHYSRVKLVRPIEGTVHGHAVADVIHLIAELVENATKFSAPSTQVLVRAQQVTAGLAIDVEDRGLGMPHEEQSRINMMLSAPDEVDIDELLKDGRIGLFVVASLARRHKVAVQLRTNIYGGTQATVVLPPTVMGDVSSPKANGHTGTQPAITTAPPVQQLPAAPVPRTEPVTEAPRPAEPSRPGAEPARTGGDDTVAIPLQQRKPVEPETNAKLPTRPIRSEHPSPPPALSAADIPPGSFDGFATHPPSRDTEPLRGYPQHQGMGTPTAGEPPNRWTATPHAAAEEAPSFRDASSRFDEYWGTGTAENASATSRSGKPELPKRRQQSHLAPQLRDTPRSTTDTELEGHDPGLMRAFQRGKARSEEES